MEWLRHEQPGVEAGARVTPRIPLPRQVIGWQPFTRRIGLDSRELASSALAVVVSGRLHMRSAHPYAARRVVGDLIGLAVLTLPVVCHRARLGHEAMVCLIGTVVVHAVDPAWPREIRSSVSWALTGAGLTGYLLARWWRLPSSRSAARRERRRLAAAVP